MSGVDSRIVTMKFDNKQFEQGASQTMSTLDKLKASLNFSGASKGLAEVQGSVDKVNFGHIEGGISKISASFVALSTVAITALSGIASKAMAVAGSTIQSLSGVKAMMDGFSDYELKIGATQTIMAGTGENIGTVTKYLKDLDIYADKTIYSLSDMTSNIGKFTNAGVKLPVAVEALKGIANVAALSGANSEEAARAMYNLGQAIGQGSVKLMDWKSVELANMGTKEFKEQLIAGAVAAGSLTKGIDGTVKSAKGSVVNFKTFSSTLSEGWLTSKALTDTLGNYADETTKIGKKAYKAATEVKTFGMMMETLKAAAGTGWTDSFETVIGTLPEATKLFTGLTNSIGGFIGASADARNKVLKDWKELGGRKDLIKGLKNVFKALAAVVTPIKEAFREIFPATTGKQLADLTEKFLNFTKHLKISGETADNLKSTFKGVFAVFSIAKQIISGIVGVIFDLIGAFASAAGSGGGLLQLTGNIGDFIAGIDAALKKGDLLKNFFDKIGAAAVVPIKALKEVASAIAALFTGGSSTILDGLIAHFASAGPFIESFQAKIQSIVNYVKNLGGFDLSKLFSFGTAGSTTASSIDGIKSSLDSVPSILDRIKTAWGQVVGAFKAAGNFLAPIGAFLKTAFNEIKTKVMEFVKGLGVEDALALINTGFFIALYAMMRGFIKSMKGIVDEFKGVLESASGVLDQVTNNLKTMQASVRADIILKIAGALALLTASIWVLSKIDSKSLGKALGAIVIMLGELVVSLKLLEKNADLKSGASLTLLSAAMIGLSLALIAMAGAIYILGNMDFETIKQGLITISAILGVITVAVALLNKSGGAVQLVVAAAAIAVLAGALTIFAGAIKLFSMLDTKMMLEGGLKIAASLLVITAMMSRMPPNMVGSAVALIIVAQALVILSAALKVLGTLSGGDTAQALILLGGALWIISAALNSMTTALPGAAAMLIFAAALNIFVPALLLLGKARWQELALGIGAIVVAFLLLGGAAGLLSFIAPAILATGTAMLVLGAALALIGGGMFLFATGFAIMAASGVAGAAALTAAIISIAELIPLIAQQVGLGIIAIAKVIGDGAPLLAEAFTKMLVAFIDQAKIWLPKIPPIASQMLDTFLAVLVDAVPKLAKAGYKMLIAILETIRDNAYQMAHVANEIITKFLDGLASNVKDVVAAGARLLVKYIDGISENIQSIIDAGGNLIIKFIEGMGEKEAEIADAAMTAVIKFVNSVATSIDTHAEELGDAGRRLGGAIVNGLTGGMGGKAVDAYNKIREIAKNIIGIFSRETEIKSPSKVFEKLGNYITEGLSKGIIGGASDVKTALDTLTSMVADSVNDAKSAVNDAKNDLENASDAVKKAQARLKDLQNNKHKNADAIKAAKVRLAEAKEVEAEAKRSLAAAKDAQKAAVQANLIMTQSMLEQQNQLRALGSQYDDITAQLKDANDALDSAISTRNSAHNSIRDKFDDLPDIAEATSLGSYEEQLRKAINDTAKFKSTLDQLRSMGMDDTTYQKFLDEGTSVQPFLEQLLAGGAPAIAELNALDAQLAAIADSLGAKASSDMYQVGVDMAQGLVDGLSASKASIEAQMTAISNTMIGAIKAALGIASPSKAFAQIGRYSILGLSYGLDKYSYLIEQSAEDVADSAVTSLQRSMRNLSDAISGDIDMTPVIAPVLDLTQLRKDALQIGSLIDAQKISANISYDKASSILNDRASAAASTDSLSTAPVNSTTITLEQNNYSPKALSPVEIYRQTRNQLSLAKEALTT